MSHPEKEEEVNTRVLMKTGISIDTKGIVLEIELITEEEEEIREIKRVDKLPGPQIIPQET